MAVKIIEDKIPAKEKLRLSNLFYKALKENVQSMLFIVFSFITMLFVIVVTWCAFTIHTQNKLIIAFKFISRPVFHQILLMYFKFVKN